MITVDRIEQLAFEAAQEQTEQGPSIAACLFALCTAIQLGPQKLFELGAMCQGFFEREALDTYKRKLPNAKIEIERE
jgi:hypothetical protein